MRSKRGPMLLLVSAALLVIGVASFTVSRYMRSVNTWSEGSHFGHKVADAVGEAVADGVVHAIGQVGRELAEVRVGDKRLTIEELARLRDLYAAGKLDQVRGELNSRFAKGELHELQRRLEALAERSSKRDSP